MNRNELLFKRLRSCAPGYIKEEKILVPGSSLGAPQTTYVVFLIVNIDFNQLNPIIKITV